MEIVYLIKNNSTEIYNIYDVLNEISKNLDNETKKSNKLFIDLIESTNTNVCTINKRLNQMDMDITDKDKIQSNKRQLLSKELDNIIKENNKKNGIYKTELTKRLTKIKRESIDDVKDVSKNVGLLKVEVDKINKTKELLLIIKKLEERLNKQLEEFNKYKEEMEKINLSLKREMRITRNMKAEKIKGLFIK